MTPRRERPRLSEVEASKIGRDIRRYPSVKKVVIQYSSWGYPVVIVRLRGGKWFSIANHDEHLQVVSEITKERRA